MSSYENNVIYIKYKNRNISTGVRERERERVYKYLTLNTYYLQRAYGWYRNEYV